MAGAELLPAERSVEIELAQYARTGCPAAGHARSACSRSPIAAPSRHYATYRRQALDANLLSRLNSRPKLSMVLALRLAPWKGPLTMRRLRVAAAIAAVTALTAAAHRRAAAALATGDGGNKSPKTLTYWASNQGTSLDDDKQMLDARAGEVREADRHQGQARGGPLVRPAQPDPRRHHLRPGPGRAQHRQHLVRLAAGHRRAAALRRRDPRRRSAARTASSPPRSPPPAPRASPRRPCRSTPWPTASTTTRSCSRTRASRARRRPGTSWSPTARSSPSGGKYGLGRRGRQHRREHPPRVHLRPAARRGLLRRRGQADFDSPGAVAGVKQYVDFMAERQDRRPGNAEYAHEPVAAGLRQGKAAMLMWQAAAPARAAHGMKPDDYGVAPVPVAVRHARPGRQQVNSDGRRHQPGGLQEHQEQGRRAEVRQVHDQRRRADDPQQDVRLAPAGARRPSSDPAFQTRSRQVLRRTSSPRAPRRCPRCPRSRQFETLVGTAMKDLFADAAAGKPVTDESDQGRADQGPAADARG